MSTEPPLYIVQFNGALAVKPDPYDGDWNGRCFGTPDEARGFITEAAAEAGLPPGLWKILEFEFTGRVLEG